MQALLQEISPPRPGYACLVLSQIKNAQLPGEARFIFQRASDRKFLDAGGWQDNQVELRPVAAHFQDEDLYLQIGPEVVDYLETGEDYRLYLSWPGQNLQLAGLKAGEITYSLFKRREEEVKGETAENKPPDDSALEQEPARHDSLTPAQEAGRFSSREESAAAAWHRQRPDGEAAGPGENESPQPYQRPEQLERSEPSGQEEPHTLGSVFSSAIGLIGVMFLIALLLYFFL